MAKSNVGDLRGKTAEELAEYIRTSGKELLENRFKNFTNQLNDTSQIKKSRRNLARAMTVRTERAKAPSTPKQGEGQ